MSTITTAPAERAAYTITEAAELLCVSRATLRSLIAAGTVPTVPLGKRKLIPGDFISRYRTGESE